MASDIFGMALFSLIFFPLLYAYDIPQCQQHISRTPALDLVCQNCAKKSIFPAKMLLFFDVIVCFCGCSAGTTCPRFPTAPPPPGGGVMHLPTYLRGLWLACEQTGVCLRILNSRDAPCRKFRFEAPLLTVKLVP